MKTTCEYCNIEVEADLVAHSSGLRGIPACSVIGYSCGCSVKYTEGKSVITTHDGKEIELEKK